MANKSEAEMDNWRKGFSDQQIESCKAEVIWEVDKGTRNENEYMENKSKGEKESRELRKSTTRNRKTTF